VLELNNSKDKRALLTYEGETKPCNAELKKYFISMGGTNEMIDITDLPKQEIQKITKIIMLYERTPKILFRDVVIEAGEELTYETCSKDGVNTTKETKVKVYRQSKALAQLGYYEKNNITNLKPYDYKMTTDGDFEVIVDTDDPNAEEPNTVDTNDNKSFKQAVKYSL
jgi:hypothetical protein